MADDDNLSRARDWMIEEYILCKNRLAALEAEAIRVEVALTEIVTFLRDEDGNASIEVTDFREELFSEMLIKLVNDLAATRREYQQLGGALNQIGVDGKG